MVKCKSNFSKTFAVYFGVLVMIFVLNYLVLAWTEPSVTPPSGNVAAPLNVGNIAQSKSGGLVVNTGNATTGLVVAYGNVGIGTTSPSQKLEVKGSILATEDVCNSAGYCLSQMAALIGSQLLVNFNHTYKNCTDAGGTVTPIDVAFPLCRFINAASCPSSWAQYKNWSATTANISPNGCLGCATYSCACNTGSHTWYNAPVESCNWAWYYSCCYNCCCRSTSWYATIYATVIEIGCY